MCEKKLLEKSIKKIIYEKTQNAVRFLYPFKFQPFHSLHDLKNLSIT